MKTNDIQLDFVRRYNTISNTETFTKTLHKLNKLGICMSCKGLAKMLQVNPKTILAWEKSQLIFPKKVGKSNYRHYELKDVLRGLTIKYLMSEMGFRKYNGVKLLLEVTNRSLKYDLKNKLEIDNIYIDRYLMRVLNYNIEGISQMRLHGNNKRYSHDSNE